MPGKVGVKIKAGRNLPVMDRGSDTTDAYVEIKLGNVTHKTDVCRKSLNPQWNTDWFRFEIDDAELQDEPLQIRLMDHDTYSANDAIGKVNISLNPLCLETSGQTTQGKGTVLSGWIPVFDTMHGIRGEVNVIVKVDLFSDLNKFRQSSCGIQFFHSQCIPHGYRAQVIHGFVEELVVNDDPEYQWIDKIRTPRASNEARQVVFLKLSGQVQRKMGLKAINMGANAVIGYTQCFDLEGDVGVVARGIGTAVTLIKDTIIQPTTTDNALIEENRRQYLHFLTGGTSGCAFMEPEYKLKIKRSQSSASFEIKRTEDASDEEGNEIMTELIRQEDARGEKPPVKKLKDQVRHLTRSSKDLFNIKQKFSEIGDSKKSPENSIAKSLIVLFPNSLFIKEESSSTSSGCGSGATVKNTNRMPINLIRKQSFKAKPINKTIHQPPKQYPVVLHKPFKKTLHPIVRSVSDDSPMKHLKPYTDNDIPLTVAAYNDFQDSTRSSPSLPMEDDLNLPRTINAINSGTKLGRLYDYSITNSCSSSLSCTLSESSSSSVENEETNKRYNVKPKLCKNISVQTDDTEEEREKIEKFIEMCRIQQKNKDDIDEQLQYKWMKPTPDRDNSLEDSLEDVQRSPSLLRELKVFSQHMQDLIYTPKKTCNTKSMATETAKTTKTEIHDRLPNTLALPTEILGERKSHYSSQPDLMAESNDNMHALTPQKPQVSQSFTNIRTVAELPLTKLLPPPLAIKRSYNDLVTNTNTKAHAATASPNLNSQPPNFPILKICPSTPTPSESDSSQVSPNSVTNLAAHYSSSSSSSSAVSLVSPCTLTPDKYSEPFSKIDPNVGKTDSCSKPNLSLSTICNTSNTRNHNTLSKHTCNNTNTSKSSLLAPSSPLFCIKHHRSLNELNASAVAASAVANVIPPIGNTTDSPSMKRFTSPASAAVVAAAAAPTTTTSTSTTPSGSVMGSRSKLTPSPSKTGIASTALPAATMMATNVTSINSSNISSENSTVSTATSVIPKEVGEICRRSSDSDLSVTPKGNSFCVASERLVAATALMRLTQPSSVTGKSSSATDSAMDMLEYPFLTMTKYPAGFILHFGATVAARSVKLLERVPNPDEPEIRDSWWTELRMEIRSHARALGCNVVLGYSESTTISDDVCVLSATGTAAVINMAYNRSASQTDIMPKPTVVGGGATMSGSLDDRDILKEVRNGISETAQPGGILTKEMSTGSGSVNRKFGLPPLNIIKNSCTACHIPYNLSSVPFNTKMKKCAICKKGRVPDVLLATLEVPEYLQVTGRGCFMQAQVVRAKKDLRSELNAKEISDGLPFLEYELHRVLINKLKAKGMNAIFGLKAQVAIGERMIALIATGTALFLTALPVPQVPKIVAGNSWTDKQKLNELQKKLQETFERNQEIYQLKCLDPDLIYSGSANVTADKQSDTDDSDEEIIEVDLNCGNKDTCVLEVDDIEDLEIISLLMEPYPPEGFHVVNTQMVPGMIDMEAVKNLQMFAQVWRAKLDVGQNVNGFPKHFQRLLQTIYFKLRTMIPCAICDLRFRLDLPESDQIQLLVTGMALGLGEASGKIKYRRKTVTNGTNAPITDTGNNLPSSDIGSAHGQKRTLQEEDYIFPLDEDHMVETPTPTTNLPPYGSHSFKLRKTSPSRPTIPASNVKSTSASFRNRYFPLRDRYGVDITPLSFIPGGKIEKYLGNLNFFFIRESTSIRENGGISGFVHGFITELLAVVRAHISALGGNAMVSFYMTELILVDNQHKNQGQCLISIGGDAVYVSYYTDD